MRLAWYFTLLVLGGLLIYWLRSRGLLAEVTMSSAGENDEATWVIAYALFYAWAHAASALVIWVDRRRHPNG